MFNHILLYFLPYIFCFQKDVAAQKWICYFQTKNQTVIMKFLLLDYDQLNLTDKWLYDSCLHIYS